MKVLDFSLTALIGAFFVFLLVLYHVLRLGRNVAHFFFKAIATLLFIGSFFAFNGDFQGFGLESYTGCFFLLASLVFSLMPEFYDDVILVKLSPEELYKP